MFDHICGLQANIISHQVDILWTYEHLSLQYWYNINIEVFGQKYCDILFCCPVFQVFK